MAAPALAEQLLRPLDVARRDLLRGLGPFARALIRDRSLRVAVFGLLAVAATFSAALLCPLWLLGLGPVLIGVPHLLADIRYLVLRPGLHRRALFWGAIALPLALGSAFPTHRFGLLAVAGGLLLARGPLFKRFAGFAAWGAASAVVLHFGRTADLAVLQLHNLLTLGLWWFWRPRRTLLEGTVIVAFALGSAFLFSGEAEPIVRWAHGFWAPGTGLTFHALAQSLVPLAPPVLAVRLVLFYGFAQALHYTVWIRVIPEDDRERPTPRTFAASWRALKIDFGTFGAPLAVLLATGMALWGAFDLASARAGYLNLSLFHFDLEFAVLAFCFVEGHRPGKNWRAADLPLSAPSARFRPLHLNHAVPDTIRGAIRGTACQEAGSTRSF